MFFEVGCKKHADQLTAKLPGIQHPTVPGFFISMSPENNLKSQPDRILQLKDLCDLEHESLRLIRQVALNQLYRLQSSNDIAKIEYWTSISAYCISLLNTEKDG